MTPANRAALAATAVARAPAEQPLLQVENAIHAATRHLLSLQAPEGYWVAELEADTTLQADYILLQLWLYPPGPDGIWNPPTRSRVNKAARQILSRQLPGGGWLIYPGGSAHANASVKSYVALKIAGLPDCEAAIEKAKRKILELGGVEAAYSYIKIYLSFFGLYDREKTPTIPPELFLLPKKARFNIYDMSSWTRTMIAPLAILTALRASRPIPAGLEIREIITGREPPKPEFFSWRNLLMCVDEGLKLWEKRGSWLTRRKAINATAKWMFERLENSDGLGAIFPPMMNSIMALTELGYGLDHPRLKREIEKFDQLLVEEDDVIRVQPCLSPVWDTALSSYAIGSANPEPDAAIRKSLRRAADWLLTKEVRHYGDWSVKNDKAAPGGWYFEFSNEFYPDTDDTAKVLLAMQHARACDPEAQRAAEQRGIAWLLSMQSKDGGWAGFDVDNDNQYLTYLPFADHNAMLDPTCADVTGRVLEALCRVGPGRHNAAVWRGVEYLKNTQEEDGSWSGRWGVNYIYGTCFALRGLRAAGEDEREPYIIRSGEWLRSIQNTDGGWGETCASYDDPHFKSEGDSAPSQTAWGLMGLFASGDYCSDSVAACIQYLLSNQNADGSWDEDAWTGTGFPRVIYLRYHLYRQYFPLMALGIYNDWLRGQ